MNKHQLLNIKKMIFELGRGGCKNHFFDRVNDAREVKRFFAFVQNDDCENAGKRGRAARKFSRPPLWHVLPQLQKLLRVAQNDEAEHPTQNKKTPP